MKYYLGIDVGTGSARAGLFDENGALLATAKHDIKMHHPHTGWAEQSTADIWQAVCHAVRQTLTAAALPGDAVTAIGFDATCSLALADSDFQPHARRPAQNRCATSAAPCRRKCKCRNCSG